MAKKKAVIKGHLDQAVHNYTFYCEVDSKLTEAFYDWKISSLFYTATHLLRAVMANRDIKVDPSHDELIKALNPRIGKRGVKKHCYDSFLILYNASIEARYSIIFNSKHQDYLNSRLAKCKSAMESIESFVKSEGFNNLKPIRKAFSVSQ